jgi:flagellar motility protein MotE (MotC chaperone)
MSYKPRSLFRIIEDVNTQLFLPHIQRPFVWEEDQMIRLFDSLMRNYPIQTLLFWRTKDEIKARRFMDVIDWDAELSGLYDTIKSAANTEKVFVLDGQQRIQTLYALFKGGTEAQDGSGRQDAYLDVTSGDHLINDDLLYRVTFTASPPSLPNYRIADLLSKDEQKNSEELADELNEQLDDLLTEEPEEERARQRRVRRNISQLVSLLREEKYFWVQELDGVANEFSYKKVLDIFVRVNSGGTKLDASDLMFAVMKEGWADVEEAIENTTELLNGTNLQFDKTFPLKCLLVAHGRGAEANPEKFTGTAGETLLAEIEASWDKAERAFMELRDFIEQDLKLYADKVIRSYNSFIPLFDYLFHNPSPDEQNRIFMRAYHYKAQLFGWYSQSTDALVNALHGIVGKPQSKSFPLEEIKDYIRKSRGSAVELQSSHLKENRLRFIILNLIYVDRMGTAPFNVKYKGNEPHVDHIYPQHALRTRLGFTGSDINHIGNFRFIGATDNQRKRAELPASYFGRLKSGGVDIEKHLLLADMASDPSKLVFDAPTYLDFRNRRFEEILKIANRVVNPELS